LKSVGVGKGDAVIIYLPMLLELPIAMLACARIGAVHSVTATTTICNDYLINPSVSFSML
jgi:acetyl-CoA synthetase